MRFPVTNVRGKGNDVWLKRSVVQIQNHHGDTLCMARALAVCESYAQQDGTAKARNSYTNMCKPHLRKQYARALAIQRAAGFSAAHIPDVTDYVKFEEALQAQIVILSASRASAIIYAGCRDRPTK
jgi:hypothetical protein